MIKYCRITSSMRLIYKSNDHLKENVNDKIKYSNRKTMMDEVE